jgi:pimeloyl-ACP methyl ester carboxylesterase
MVTHHRFAEIAGRRIFYREAGSPAAPAAPAVVLLHGTPASSHQYRNLIPALADRYHVIVPDYPGLRSLRCAERRRVQLHVRQPR